VLPLHSSQNQLIQDQFVDSLVLMRIMRSVHRQVSWLMAAKSFNVPVIGTLAKGIAAVPVARSMDLVKNAEGRISLVTRNDAKLWTFRGTGTKFDETPFEVGGSIHFMLGVESIKLEICFINGPYELIVKKAPGAENLEKAMTGSISLEFGVSPKIDQAAVYEAVFDRLSMDGCVGIFPEGGSHDRTDLLSLQGRHAPFMSQFKLTFRSRCSRDGSRCAVQGHRFIDRTCWLDLLSSTQVPLKSSRGVWKPCSSHGRRYREVRTRSEEGKYRIPTHDYTTVSRLGDDDSS